MADPAAFRATYSDWKIVKTRSCVQIVFEVPIEESDQAYQVLGGMPKPASECWCAIARLKSAEENAAPEPPSSPLAERMGAARKEVTLAQRAAFLCKETYFQNFIEVTNEEAAADWLREECGVQSRSEIIPGSKAAGAYGRVVARYDAWQRKL